MKSNSLAVRLLIYALALLLTRSKFRGETERVQNTHRMHQTDMVGYWNYMAIDVVICCCGETVAIVCIHEK